MSLFRTLLMEKQGGGILPAGYTQLNYIKSNATQAIETDWGPSSYDACFRHEAIMGQQNYREATTLFGNYANGYRIGGFWSYQGDNPVTIGNGEYLFGHTLGQGAETWKLSVDGINREITADFNGIIETTTFSGSFHSGFTLMLFSGMFGYETSEYALYDFKTYEINNGVETLVRHYIPALRDADGEAGLYEVCENIFYTTTQGDPFTYA